VTPSGTEGSHVADDPKVRKQLDEIERHLTELEGATRILWALRLLQDGHAPDWTVAVAWARDPERLRRLYPQAFREAEE
jgi:hypothetical protein